MKTIASTVTTGVKSSASPFKKGHNLCTGPIVSLDIFPKKLFTPGIMYGLKSPNRVNTIIDSTSNCKNNLATTAIEYRKFERRNTSNLVLISSIEIPE